MPRSVRATRALSGIAILCLALALGGCGQKGALYLPDKSKTRVPPSTAPAPAPRA